MNIVKGPMGNLAQLLILTLFSCSVLGSIKLIDEQHDTACNILRDGLKDGNLRIVWNVYERWPYLQSSAILQIAKNHSTVALGIIEHYEFFLRLRVLLMAIEDFELGNYDVLRLIFQKYRLLWRPTDQFANCLFYMGYALSVN